MLATQRTALSPGTALWSQRERLATSRDRFEALCSAVGRPSDLNLHQWTGLAAFALEFRPDLIVELGRGWGNSTCCFTEVANLLGGAGVCRVVSLCLSDDWFTRTRPRVSSVVPPEWFAPADIRTADILETDPGTLLKGGTRCLVFWDAHGFDIAEWVLSKLLPQLLQRSHLVLMHDVCDAQYDLANVEYGQSGIWKGRSAETPSFCLANINSNVAQAICVLDFLTRNHLRLHTAAESIRAEIGCDPERVDTLKKLLGSEMFSFHAGWVWFTLNEASSQVTFPVSTMTAERHRRDVLFRRMEQLLEGLGSEDITALVNAIGAYGSRTATFWQQVMRSNLSSGDIDRLTEAIEKYAQGVSAMALRCGEIENSAGWRALNGWRSVRERLLREGTGRRRLYDSLIGYLTRDKR